MAHVFISYSRKDKGFALFIKEQLTSFGFETWMDIHDIKGGQKWKARVNEGLEQCQLVVLILSPNSVKSKNVRYEWEYAIENHKPLIPILFFDIKEYPNELSHFNIISFLDEFRLLALRQSIDEIINPEVANLPIDTPNDIRGMIDALKHWNNDTKVSALQNLGQKRSESAIPYIGKTLLDDENDRVRLEATLTLEAIGSIAAVPYLIKALDDPSPNVKNAVIKRLGKLGEKRAVHHIGKFIKDESSLIYTAVFEALSEIGGIDAANYLISYYFELDLEGHNRTQIYNYVAKLNQEDAVPVLLEFLKDTNANMRSQAASLLSTFPSQQAVQPLIQALADEDSEVVRLSLYSLSRINLQIATPYLIDALNNNTVSSIRWTAAMGLRNAENKEEVVSTLVRALEDENKKVKIESINALSEINAKSSVSYLIQLLQDVDKNVQYHVINALKLLKTPEALAAVTNWEKFQN